MWMSSLLAVPCYLKVGLRLEDWIRIKTRFDFKDGEELQLVICAWSGMLGSWLGSWLIPLDWNRVWQKWPLPSLFGAILGASLGLLVGFLKELVFSGKNVKRTLRATSPVRQAGSPMRLVETITTTATPSRTTRRTAAPATSGKKKSPVRKSPLKVTKSPVKKSPLKVSPVKKSPAKTTVKTPVKSTTTTTTKKSRSVSPSKKSTASPRKSSTASPRRVSSRLGTPRK